MDNVVKTYSKLKRMRLKNFRNLGDVEIDFTESPIVTLYGDNEAGKTSVIRGFSVCALHSHSREQKGYIRDGTSGFGIELELEDGTKITRLKTEALNKYMVEKNGVKLLDINKLEGLPELVSDIMGMIEEPETKEFLQIRTYSDKLLFIDTPASTNFKVMYNTLKVEQLSKAIRLGNDEANEKKSLIMKQEASINTLLENVRSIRLLDLEPVLNIRDRLEGSLENFKKLVKVDQLLKNIEDNKRNLGVLTELKESGIDEIDVRVYEKVESLKRLVDRNNELRLILESTKEIRKAKEINSNILSMLVEVNDRYKNTWELRVESERLKGVEKLPIIDEYKYKLFGNVLERLYESRKKESLSKVLNSVELSEITQADLDKINNCAKILGYRERIEKLNKYNDELKKNIVVIDNFLKESGVLVQSCPNCGEAVIMEIGEHMH